MTARDGSDPTPQPFPDPQASQGKTPVALERLESNPPVEPELDGASFQRRPSDIRVDGDEAAPWQEDRSDRHCGGRRLGRERGHIFAALYGDDAPTRTIFDEKETRPACP